MEVTVTGAKLARRRLGPTLFLTRAGEYAVMTLQEVSSVFG
jgi:hypothetical protein